MCMIATKTEKIYKSKIVYAIRATGGFEIESPFTKHIWIPFHVYTCAGNHIVAPGEEIDIGFFHVFSSKRLAKKFLIKLSKSGCFSNKILEILEHIIPANTTIVHGKISSLPGYGIKCIATKRLMLI